MPRRTILKPGASPMMLRVVFSLVLVAFAVFPSLWLTLPDSTGRAENSAPQSTVTAERIVASGLQRIIFTGRRGGRVFVNLPEDLRAGEACSGSIFLEGSGKTDAERAASNEELRNYVVEIAGQKISATGKTFDLNIAPAHLKDDIGRVILRDQNGREVARAEFKVLLQATSHGTDFRLPTAQLGEMIQVECPCDGVMTATDYVKIGAEPNLFIAESPRARWAFNTNPVKGPTEIEVSEHGRVIKGKISILGIKLSALKTDLLKGEQTTLIVEVSGLEGLKEPVPLRLENKTPDVLTMEPSNVQELIIKPAEVLLGGKYTTQRTLTGIRVGSFHIEGTVVRRADQVGQEDNMELVRLAEEDQADRASPAAKLIDWRLIEARHRERLVRVKEFTSQKKLRTENDYYRAALLLVRGVGPEDYRLGRELNALISARQGSLQPLQLVSEQDCSGGIPVCQGTFVQAQSYTGVGNIQESSGTCLGAGESNSVWYILQVQSSGSLFFTINTPNDYDFALYNITSGGCSGVPGSTPIRCNYSGTNGATGLVAPAQAELPPLSVNSSGPPTMPGVNVTAGQTYALVVNNFSGNQNGYTLTISGTATFSDATIPTLVSASMDPAECQVVITLSEPVRCSSITANGSDFQLNAPGGAVVTGASGIGCGTYTNKIRLSYSVGEASACGAWTISSQTGTDGNTLVDNCNNQLATGGTVTLATPPPAVAQVVMPSNAFCEGSTIIADGSGSTGEIRHFWSVVEADANWNVIGTEYSAWFPGQASTFDVSQFATQQGFTLKCGKYYRVKVAVQNCCTRWSESVQLIRILCPPVADAGPDRTVCCNGPVKMQIGSAAVPGVTYSWSPTIGLDDPTSSNPTIDFSTFNGTSVAFPSVYEVTATDSAGCSSKDSVFIKTVCACRPPAKVTVTRRSICSRTFTLTADCACADTTPTYLWNPGGATTQSIDVPAASGPYTVTCRNECGATVSRPISVPDATPLEGGFPSIQCPNVFTPNGDNVNDFWVVLDLSQSVGATPAYNATDYEFEVFDRWGSRVVFMSGSTTTGFANGSIPHWDGVANQNVFYSWWQHLWGKDDTYAGSALSDGTYYYIFRMKNCSTGWTDICYGFITILR